MTIDEAIKFCHEKSENIKLKAEPQVFIDIANMLEELKVYKECNISKTNFKMGYNKAIDDCLYIVQSIKDKHNEDKSYPINYGTICGLIIELQDLKAGGIDENERTDT